MNRASRHIAYCKSALACVCVSFRYSWNVIGIERLMQHAVMETFSWWMKLNKIYEINNNLWLQWPFSTIWMSECFEEMKRWHTVTCLPGHVSLCVGANRILCFIIFLDWKLDGQTVHLGKCQWLAINLFYLTVTRLSS